MTSSPETLLSFVSETETPERSSGVVKVDTYFRSRLGSQKKDGDKFTSTCLKKIRLVTFP